MGIKKKAAEKVIKTIAKSVSVDKIIDGTINKVTNSIEKGISEGVKTIANKKKNKIEDIKNYKVKNNTEDIINFFIEAKKNIKDKNIDEEEYKMWFLKIEEVYEKAEEIITDKKSLNKITRKYEELKREKKIKNIWWIIFVVFYVFLGGCLLFGLNGNFLTGLGISILLSSVIIFVYFNIDFGNIKRSIKNFEFKETTENILCVTAGSLSILLIIFGLFNYYENKNAENESYNNYYDEDVEKFGVSIDVNFKDNVLFNKCDVTVQVYDEEEHFKHGEDKTFNINLPKGTHKIEFISNDDNETEKLEINGDTKVKYKLECLSGGIEVSQISKKDIKEKDDNDNKEETNDIEDNEDKKEEISDKKENITIGETKTGTESNIDYKTYFTDNGEMIIIATNNNSKNVDIDVEVEFYDKNKKLVGVESDSITASSKESEFSLDFKDIPKSYDSYKIYIDVEETDASSYTKVLKAESEKSEEKVVVQIKNTTDKEIEYIKASIIFYKGEKIVGYDYSLDEEIKPDRSANFEFDYPFDENLENIEFDNYEIYINEAYISE
ncbi:MAG: hypothetical protein IJ399_04085 [Bacilli bacterium]|nr:hypothetical protein [Bacilli bacterium]